MANIFDATNAPETEPLEIVAGDFVQWKDSILPADYPIADYSLVYVARSVTGSDEFQVTATTANGYYLLTILSATTAALPPGLYRWQKEIIKTSTSQRVVIKRGEFKVVVDLDVSGVDSRSHAEIMVTKIESILAGKADSDVQSYSVAGRSLTKMSFQELLDARNFYRSEVMREKAKEDAKNGRQGASTVKVRF
jgi:hypothetical protein